MNILEDLYELRHSIYESSTIENTLNHFMWFSDNSVDINLRLSGSLIFSFLISKIEILSNNSPTDTSARILFIKKYTMLSC